MFKSSDLISKEACTIWYSLKDLKATKSKSYFNGIALKELFATKGFNFSKADIVEVIDSKVPQSIFSTLKECEVNKDFLVKKLMRFKEYEEDKVIKRSEIRKANNLIVDIGTISISVDFHLILNNNADNSIEVIKFKNKKCNIKKRGQSIYTKTSENMELFLLQKAGEKLFPTKKVYGTIVFLTNPKDSSNKLVVEFETKENENIASYHFEDKGYASLTNRVIELATSSLSTCNKDCSYCNISNICNYVHKDDTLLKEIPQTAKAGKVKFTPSQLDFIEIEEGNYRVLAGAGSGKTTVIANRIVNLIKKGTQPSDILLITYTTKGVEELKEKINYWLSINKIKYTSDDFDIFTFNGYGYELIKKEYKSLGFSQIPQVLDSVTKMDIIKELLDNNPKIEGLDYANPFMNLYNAKGAVIKISNYFEIIKENGLIHPDEVMEECVIKDEQIAKCVLQMYLKYSNILKKNSIVDFSDQLQLAYNILSNPENVKRYGYSHIMVDEFQDSATLQINTLKLLRDYPYCKSLVVVGDDAQSIFGFRGANQFNIINFHKFFNNVKDIAMEENFRSTKEICNLANFLNNINKNKIDKNLISTNTGDSPLIISNTGKNNSIDTIIENINKKVSKGTKLNNLCIIARNKVELIEAQKKLTTLGIPSIIAVSETLIDNDKVKNIIGYSNFLVDTSLDLHFAEYLQISQYDNFEKEKNTNNLTSFINDEKIKFLSKYESCSDNKDKLEFFFNSLTDVAKIDKAVARLLEVCKEKEFSSIEGLNIFLSHLNLYNSDLFVEKSIENYEAITLTTAHSSKGREFEDVYISLDKFKYPKKIDSSNRNNYEVEEERRLLYVAITRAKKNLTIVGKYYSSIFKEVQEGFDTLSKAV